jgi:uncharacterized protein
MNVLSGFFNDVARVTQSVGAAVGLGTPVLRLGVTGLSRAGKTVFITALVQALVGQGKLPAFAARAEGRIKRAYLMPQPDDVVPRFAYEDHLAALTGSDRHWPQSTRRISELRVMVEFESKIGGLSGYVFGNGGSLVIDIVDYPGEWLLDLALLEKSYQEWSAQALELAHQGPRERLSQDFRAALNLLPAGQPLDEPLAQNLASLFTRYLQSCRADEHSLSALPPGRFLMPGDLEGSPALTFAPLPPSFEAGAGSLHAAFERRYESYKALVVKPFFRDHFARLDRQIVLVDVLTALNAGAGAIADLETAMADILAAFRVGQSGVLSSIFSPRINKVLFAATKADQLHHTSHDRLEAILSLITRRALARVEGSGASGDVVALAAVRATREVEARQNGENLACIAGVPLAGEIIGKESFDGMTEAAVFPGDLPEKTDDVLRGLMEGSFHSLRFRPPQPLRSPDGRLLGLPQIRLDRTLEFLFGDYLR